jgi:hypothetical protein
MLTAAKVPTADAPAYRDSVRALVSELMVDVEFSDLIGRSVDHKKRTIRRFELWIHKVDTPLLV